MAPRDELFEAERLIDARIDRLPALTMPRDDLLKQLYSLIWLAHAGGINGDQPANRAFAVEITHRLSLITHLLKKAPTTRLLLPRSFESQQRASLGLLVAYMHFCEIMPDVWHDNYRVVGSALEPWPSTSRTPARDLRTFRLEYPDPAWMALEAQDVALSTIGMPQVAEPPQIPFDTLEAALVAFHGGDRQPAAKIISRFADHYLNIREDGLLGDSGLRSGIDMSEEAFRRCRALLMAVAQWSLQNTWLIQSTGANALQLEEWISTRLDWEQLRTMVTQASGASPDAARDFLALFTLGALPLASSSRLDGFYPPLARSGDGVTFSPFVLLDMMTERNIAIALLRKDERRFAQELSHHLEPKLLADMIQILRAADPYIKVTRSKKWRSQGQASEIDAIVTRPGRPGILHVHAKGAIPPTGARMTRSFEETVTTGLQQSRAFQALPTSAQERILTESLGRPVSGEQITGAVLVRSNFGTARIWRAAKEVCLLTLPLLRSAVRLQMERDGAISPSAIPRDAQLQLDDLQRRVSPREIRVRIDLSEFGVDAPGIVFEGEAEIPRIAVEWAMGHARQAIRTRQGSPRVGPDHP